MTCPGSTLKKTERLPESDLEKTLEKQAESLKTKNFLTKFCKTFTNTKCSTPQR
jgi:hypothetical protein